MQRYQCTFYILDIIDFKIYQIYYFLQVSLKFTSDVTIAKDFLKSRIRDRITASAILNAALRVGDYDANEQIIWERRTLKGATSKLFFF